MNDPSRAEASAHEAAGAQSRFMRLLAHELRNYVAPIQNAMHLLRLRARTDPSLLPVAEIIERQATGMLRTLDMVVEADRASRGDVVLERAPAQVSALIGRALESARAVIELRRVRVESEGLENLPAVDVDAGRIVRTLANLLDNAARYSPEGSRVVLRGALEGNAVAIAIADEGPGLPDDAQRLEFFTAPHRPGQGLGLGLPLAKTLLALHGGDLRIGSRRDAHGTEVVVRLPRADGSVSSGEGESLRAALRPDASVGPADVDAGAPGTRRRVLIADDSAPIRASLGDLLQDLGHDVRAAVDGAEAIAMAQAWQPDFVLLDIHMPKLNGFEAARKLRALYPRSQMQLVLISGDDLDDAIRRGAKDAGFDHCIDKGLAIGDLTAILAGEHR